MRARWSADSHVREMDTAILGILTNRVLKLADMAVALLKPFQLADLIPKGLRLKAQGCAERATLG